MYEHHFANIFYVIIRHMYIGMSYLYMLEVLFNNFRAPTPSTIQFIYCFLLDSSTFIFIIMARNYVVLKLHNPVRELIRHTKCRSVNLMQINVRRTNFALISETAVQTNKKFSKHRGRTKHKQISSMKL